MITFITPPIQRFSLKPSKNRKLRSQTEPLLFVFCCWNPLWSCCCCRCYLSFPRHIVYPLGLLSKNVLPFKKWNIISECCLEAERLAYFQRFSVMFQFWKWKLSIRTCKTSIIPETPPKKKHKPLECIIYWERSAVIWGGAIPAHFTGLECLDSSDTRKSEGRIGRKGFHFHPLFRTFVFRKKKCTVLS